MNHEFYQIMVGAPTMSLYSWKQLARWSLEYSCLKPEEIDEGLRILDRTWQEFCHLIVKVCDNEETGLMNGNEIDPIKAKEFYKKDANDLWNLKSKTF